MKRDIGKALVFLTLGVVLGIILNTFYLAETKFSWKGEIGFEPLINVLIAIAIAVYFNHSFQRVIDIKKIENSWVTESLKEAAILLKEMKLDFQAIYKSNELRKEFVDRFTANHRKLANHITDTKDLLSLLGHVHENSMCEEIEMKAILYKSVVTNGDPNQPFDSLDSQKHDRNAQLLGKALSEMIIKLGRK